MTPREVDQMYRSILGRPYRLVLPEPEQVEPVEPKGDDSV
jgi:hypothetical protein